MTTDELRALLAKALPEAARPLLVNGYVTERVKYADIWHNGGPGGEVARAYDDSMADLIVAAVNALPGLLDERARLVSALLFAKGTIEDLLGDFDLYQNTPEFRAYNQIRNLLNDMRGANSPQGGVMSVFGECYLSRVHAVLVTGSRQWCSDDQHVRVYWWLDRLYPALVIHGGARGADSLAHAWCKSRGREAWVFFPDWHQGKGAALRRNDDMVAALQRCAPTSVVVGFPLPESRGTYYTMRRAREAGLTVYDGAAAPPADDSKPWEAA